MRGVTDTLTHVDSGRLVKNHFLARCGTVGCIAGTALLIEKGVETYVKELSGMVRVVTWISIESEAQEVLSINHSEGQRLFFTDNWPDKFKKQLNKNQPGTEAYAEVISKRIDHFIETDGQE